jgi:chorismate mutase
VDTTTSQSVPIPRPDDPNAPGSSNGPDGSNAPDAPDENAFALLDALRASIDNLDAAVIHLLAERFKCTQKVGALKARHGMPASDPEREARQIERLHRLARDADLDPVFAERFLNFVIEEVIRHHRALAEGAGR